MENGNIDPSNSVLSAVEVVNSLPNSKKAKSAANITKESTVAASNHKSKSIKKQKKIEFEDVGVTHMETRNAAKKRRANAMQAVVEPKKASKRTAQPPIERAFKSIKKVRVHMRSTDADSVENETLNNIQANTMLSLPNSNSTKSSTKSIDKKSTTKMSKSAQKSAEGNNIELDRSTKAKSSKSAGEKFTKQMSETAQKHKHGNKPKQDRPTQNKRSQIFDEKSTKKISEPENREKRGTRKVTQSFQINSSKPTAEKSAKKTTKPAEQYEVRKKSELVESTQYKSSNKHNKKSSNKNNKILQASSMNVKSTIIKATASPQKNLASKTADHKSTTSSVVVPLHGIKRNPSQYCWQKTKPLSARPTLKKPAKYQPEYFQQKLNNIEDYLKNKNEKSLNYQVLNTLNKYIDLIKDKMSKLNEDEQIYEEYFNLNESFLNVRRCVLDKCWSITIVPQKVAKPTVTKSNNTTKATTEKEQTEKEKLVLPTSKSELKSTSTASAATTSTSIMQNENKIKPADVGRQMSESKNTIQSIALQHNNTSTQQKLAKHKLCQAHRGYGNDKHNENQQTEVMNTYYPYDTYIGPAYLPTIYMPTLEKENIDDNYKVDDSNSQDVNADIQQPHNTLYTETIYNTYANQYGMLDTTNFLNNSVSSSKIFHQIPKTFVPTYVPKYDKEYGVVNQNSASNDFKPLTNDCNDETSMLSLHPPLPTSPPPSLPPLPTAATSSALITIVPTALNQEQLAVRSATSPNASNE